MKTIEERANINFANGIITNKHDYIEGATEQKAIDVAKAKRLVSVMLDKIEQFGINGDKEIWIENFTKVMEQ